MTSRKLQVAVSRSTSVTTVGVRLLLATLALLTATAPAWAHGGGTPQLVDAPAGPYHIFAWTNPDPARVGTLHVTVALVDPAVNQPVLGADVQVRLTPLDAGAATAPITAQATHDQAAIKTYYETDLQAPAAGPWQAAITYATPQGSGSAAFDLAVEERTFSNWLLIGGAGIGLIALGWFFWPRKPQATNPVPQRNVVDDR